MNKYENKLQGGDLRSIGWANDIVSSVNSQEDFDELFHGLKSTDRKVVMRTADAIEKITRQQKHYLKKHQSDIVNLCQTAIHIELKWHLALMVSRLKLSKKELGLIWHLLSQWANNIQESKIVRVNALQGLFNLLPQDLELNQDFEFTLQKVEQEKIPSLTARIKHLRKELRK